MEERLELPIKQLDGTVEQFYIQCINNISGATIPIGQRNYSIYKSTPYKGFSINILKRGDRHYIRHIDNNTHEEYKKKNIVFAALSFIADYYQAPIYSSVVSRSHSMDDTDILVKETMGNRWLKMLERHHERVEYLGQEDRYVLYPSKQN